MPVAKAKSPKPGPKPKQVTTQGVDGGQSEREVIYPKLRIILYTSEPEQSRAVETAPPINEDMMKQILGWETEEQYVKRMLQLNPDLNPEEVKLKEWLFKDEEGNKVVCWNNSKNRPFDEAHARKLAQEQLQRVWACPMNMPGETVNGETFIVGRTGQVESGQHRGIGYMLACQLWRKNDRWKQKWSTPPVFEGILVFGVSEAPAVTQTLDNVKTRSLSDVFFTSELFRDFDMTERKECTKMLADAVNRLWKRTDATQDGASLEKYQTHSTSRGFLDRHPKILECVKFVFDHDRERQISVKGFPRGEAAAMLYLMGCCDSDVNAYRTAEPAPSEEVLSWEYWDRALSFWKAWADFDPRAMTEETEIMQSIIYEFGLLVDADLGSGGGRITEKIVILAKAWNLYKDNQPFTSEDIHPEYKEKFDGTTALAEWPVIGGIDLGDGKDHSKDFDGDAPNTKEQEEEEKAEQRKTFIEEQAEKLRVARQHQQDVEKLKKGEWLEPKPRVAGQGTVLAEMPKRPKPKPKI